MGSWVSIYIISLLLHKIFVNILSKLLCKIFCLCVTCAQSLSHVHLFVTPWTAACQAPLSMVFSQQEFWSRVPFPTPEDLPNPGIELTSLAPPELQVDSLQLYHLGSAILLISWFKLELKELPKKCPGTMKQKPTTMHQNHSITLACVQSWFLHYRSGNLCTLYDNNRNTYLLGLLWKLNESICVHT